MMERAEPSMSEWGSASASASGSGSWAERGSSRLRRQNQRRPHWGAAWEAKGAGEAQRLGFPWEPFTASGFSESEQKKTREAWKFKQTRRIFSIYMYSLSRCFACSQVRKTQQCGRLLSNGLMISSCPAWRGVWCRRSWEHHLRAHCLGLWAGAGFLSRRENDVRAEPDIAEPNQFQILVGFGQIPDSAIFGTCAQWNRTGTKEPDRAPVLPPLTWCLLLQFEDCCHSSAQESRLPFRTSC